MAVNKNFSISVPEFRHLMKVAFLLLKEISELKKDGNNTSQLKAKREELLAIYSAVSNPELVSLMQRKLKKIHKKRESRRNQKIILSANKQKAEQHRIEQHEKTDRWLNSIQNKQLHVKKENEIKKEADNILSEVKRKISEGKHNIESLAALEKLRNARKANFLAKGGFVFSKHETQFTEKVSQMRTVMQKQLSIYEDEERALSVMLETEQEGQREEEKNRKLKKLKQLQEEKQANIVECLFGNLDPPLPSDPKFMFWKYYCSGTDSVENFLKVRYEWDAFLVPSNCEEGSYIPEQWVVPEPPSSASWETALERKDSNLKKKI